MENSSSFRSWVALGFGLIAVAILLIVSPKPVYQAKGILLPAQKTYSAISPKIVDIYNTSPFNGAVVGDISIEHHATNVNQQTAWQASIEFAKKLAATFGANGVVVNQYGRSEPGEVPKPLATYYFRATAIKTN